jgi:hypothetical protein
MTGMQLHYVIQSTVPGSPKIMRDHVRLATKWQPKRGRG